MARAAPPVRHDLRRAEGERRCPVAGLGRSFLHRLLIRPELSALSVAEPQWARQATPPGEGHYPEAARGADEADGRERSAGVSPHRLRLAGSGIRSRLPVSAATKQRVRRRRPWRAL